MMNLSLKFACSLNGSEVKEDCGVSTDASIKDASGW